MAARGAPNNRNASWERDAFGRVIEHTNGDGVVTTTTYTDCAAACPTINGVVAAFSVSTYVQHISSATPIEKTWHDKLGRVLRTEKQSLDGSYSKRDIIYDSQGRVQKVSLPYFSGTPKYTVYSYDLRNRVENVLRPDGSSTGTVYSVSGDKVIATVTESIQKADGSSDGTQVKRNEFNILGQLTSTTDAYGSNSAVSTAYTYDANGNLLTATVDGGAAGTTTTTYEYDAAGNRRKIIDPDIGTVTLHPTALGQLRLRVDNKGQQITFDYDLIGRLKTRNDPDGLNTWTWDTAANGIGKLESRSGPDGFLETYSYNGAGKLSTIVTEFIPIGGTIPTSHTTSHTYDSHGRPRTTTYPGAFELTRVYNAHGYLSELRNGTTPIQTFNAIDAFGHTTHETYGNGVETSREYDPETGRLTDIVTSIGNTDLQVNEYGWYSNGILESRTAHPVAGLSSTRKETFSYDVLNRLELAETWINGSNTRDLNYQYNALGNIESKTSTLAGDTDVTGYTYAGRGPAHHAVTRATVGGVLNVLLYDDNGAVTRYYTFGGEDKWLAYNAANQPTKIVIGSGLDDTTPQVSEEFRYDPDGRRYARQSTWQEGGTTHKEHVTYVGNVEIVYDTSNGEVLWVYKTRISPNVMHVKAEWLGLIDGQPRSWNESHFEYAHRDHLGSIEVVTDDSGAELHRLAFEPFGSRRSEDWSGNISASELNGLLARGQGHAPRVRGFTGHEHLDRTGFIHMNGRIYDPVLGRFLSPDPFVQFPSFSQGWNRFSYVNNTPTSFADPTGYRADLRGTGGTTNANGYGGTVGAYARARANFGFAQLGLRPGGCVRLEQGGCKISPYPNSNSPEAFVGSPGSGANNVPEDYEVMGEALSERQEAIMKLLLADTRTAVGIEGAEWLSGYDSIGIVVGADELGADGELANAWRSADGKTARVTLYRAIFSDTYTAGDRLATMGHELRHLEPRNYMLYQREETRFRSQFKADQYGMKLGETLYPRDYSRQFEGTIMQPLGNCRITEC